MTTLTAKIKKTTGRQRLGVGEILDLGGNIISEPGKNLTGRNQYMKEILW